MSEKQLKEKDAEKVTGGSKVYDGVTSPEEQKARVERGINPEKEIDGINYGRQINPGSKKDDYVNPWK